MVLKKKHLKIFIYMIIAYFVGLAVILYDFSVSYAASFSDVPDADWRYIVAGNVYNTELNKGMQSAPSRSIPDGRPSSFVNVPDCKYSENLAYYDVKSDYFVGENVTVSSDDEIVLALDYVNTLPGYKAGTLNLVAFSKARISFARKGNWYYKGAWGDHGSTGKIGYVLNPSDDSGFYTLSLLNAWTTSSSEALEYAFMTGKMKVFNSCDGAFKYLKTGDTSGLAWQGAAPQYDGDNIYLNDFQMIVHDSNAYSAYYLEFKYTIPEQLRDAASLKLDIAETFEWTITGLSSLVAYPRNSSGTNYIDLLQNPTGFKLYLDDIDVISKFVTDIPIASTVSRRAVLGSEIAFDTSGISIGGLGGETVVKITNSKMYLTCYVVANNKYGVSYNGSLDFVSGYNDMSSYTPDSSGNYKYNDDIKKQGHYYTDVSTDAAGNVTYNYYYYGDDNSKTEISAKDSADNTLTVVPGQTGSIINNITMPDHIFVSVSGGSGSGGSSSGSGFGDVTIEDDDLSFNSLRDSIKDGYGLIDDTDTGEKGDGLVAMMSDLFGYFPASFTGLIMLGISSVVGIAILRMIFKR